MTTLKIGEIERQIQILKRNYRVNSHQSSNQDITIYVMKGKETMGSIELLFNQKNNTYTVDWAKVGDKLIGKGKLLYYMALHVAWPTYLAPGPRANKLSQRIWHTIDSHEAISRKNIDGKQFYRLKKQMAI